MAVSPPAPGCQLVEDVEKRPAPLFMPAMSVAVLAAFSTLSAFAVLAVLAVSGVPGLGPRPRGVWCGLRGRRCSVLGPSSHQFFQLTTVKPDTPAIGTHVELNSGPIHSLHGAVVIGAKKQRHCQVPQYEKRDRVKQRRASVKKCVSDIAETSPWAGQSQRCPVRHVIMVANLLGGKRSWGVAASANGWLLPTKCGLL